MNKRQRKKQTSKISKMVKKCQDLVFLSYFSPSQPFPLITVTAKDLERLYKDEASLVWQKNNALNKSEGWCG